MKMVNDEKTYNIIFPGRFQPITNLHLESIGMLLEVLQKKKRKIDTLYFGVIHPTYPFVMDSKAEGIRPMKVDRMRKHLSKNLIEKWNSLSYSRAKYVTNPQADSTEISRWCPLFNVLHRCEVFRLIYACMEEIVKKYGINIRAIPLLPLIPLSDDEDAEQYCPSSWISNLEWFVPEFDHHMIEVTGALRKRGQHVYRLGKDHITTLYTKYIKETLLFKNGCIPAVNIGIHGICALTMFNKNLRQKLLPENAQKYLEARKTNDTTGLNINIDDIVIDNSQKDSWLLEEMKLIFPPPNKTYDLEPIGDLEINKVIDEHRKRFDNISAEIVSEKYNRLFEEEFGKQDLPFDPDVAIVELKRLFVHLLKQVNEKKIEIKNGDVIFRCVGEPTQHPLNYELLIFGQLVNIDFNDNGNITKAAIHNTDGTEKEIFPTKSTKP